MIKGKKILGLIAARGGSKGLPGKNIADLGGSPLIAWTIRAGQQSTLLDRLVLSSDDAAIIAAAKDHGCDVPFVRDAALSDDTATGTDVVLDALERLPGFDYVVLLQATSPLRMAEDIDGCITHCIESAAPSCLTVTALGKPMEWLMRINENGTLDRIVPGNHTDRRQDSTPVVTPNGAVYVAETNWLRETKSFYTPDTIAYEMPGARSVDIDTAQDLAIARTLIAGRNT